MGVPKTHVQQDGGYLDIEVHPDYARNRWIYLAYSEGLPGYVPPTPLPDPPPTVPSMTVIVRGRINDKNEWTDEQLIYRAPAELYTTNGAHYGCRMIFDRQNRLFFSIGERGRQPNAQDLETPLGKIHRVNDDGSVPKDNPFVQTPGAVPTIWSYGHRNPEGFAWDPVTSILVGIRARPEQRRRDQHHREGPQLRLGGRGQVGAARHGELSLPGMDDPIVYFTPTFAPAGIAFYTGTRYPAWKNTSLFVDRLAGPGAAPSRDRRPDGGQPGSAVQPGSAACAIIAQSPDGYFYVALQDPTGVPNPAGGGNIPLSASTRRTRRPIDAGAIAVCEKEDR